MARRVYMASGLFRVSLPGFDAATATAAQLAFWEGQDSLQPLASGQISIARKGIITIPYDGNLPVFFVWAVTAGVHAIAVRKTNTQLYIDLRNNPINGVYVASATVYYVVYKNGVPVDA